MIMVMIFEYKGNQYGLADYIDMLECEIDRLESTKKQEPCEWCGFIAGAPTVQSECTWLGKPLKYCPNCGRKLQEV
jgi:hypothetical protein